MERKIPTSFESVIIDSPLQTISQETPNIGRLKVRVFTKYGNRNGSYITEAVADQLIKTACQGSTPVIGFYDPETQSWASHTGPTLANAYGYVESFLGWEPYTDTDGITRDYAVFSVVLFTDYFEEAQKILGQNQSMELDPQSITGDWALIDDTEYFVFKTAKMLGFCIIGEHEPCFSVSAFFSNNYEAQYQQFFTLLSDLKAQVEKIEINQRGGGQPMNEFENQEVEVVEETPAVDVENNVEQFEQQEEKQEETIVSEEDKVEQVSSLSEFELLQQNFEALQTSFNELQNQYNEAVSRITEFESNQSAMQNTIDQLTASVQTYQAQIKEYENIQKESLFKKYEKLLAQEEIEAVYKNINDYSYEELESKLAILFANSQIIEQETKKVPLVEPTKESQFSLLMKKYRKN